MFDSVIEWTSIIEILHWISLIFKFEPISGALFSVALKSQKELNIQIRQRFLNCQTLRISTCLTVLENSKEFNGSLKSTFLICK